MPVDFIPQFGNLLYTLIAFVAALSVIVAIHEFGHYIVGRWSGIKAEVFSLGFGPVIWSRRDKRGTQWQIAAVPLGGYVKFLGDANAASAKADEATMAALSPEERRHTIHGAPLWARAATVAAGPVFNFILSLLIFAGFSMVYGIATEEPTVARVYALPSGAGDIRPGDQILAIDGVPTPNYTALGKLLDDGSMAATRSYKVLRDGSELTVTGPALAPGRVSGVMPGSAAQEAGLKRDDVVLSVNGVPLKVFDQLRQAVAASGGKPVALEVWRAGEVRQMTLTPKSTDDLKPDGSFETRYMIGVASDMFFEPLTRTASPVESLGIAADQVKFVMVSSLNGLWHVVTGAISSCNVRGPVTIAKTSAAAASAGVKDFIWFIAAMSTAIGLLNLFPIPMLDGGHLVFNLIEWTTGHAPSGRILNALMVAGLFVVLSFMTFGLTNDFLCP